MNKTLNLLVVLLLVLGIGVIYSQFSSRENKLETTTKEESLDYRNKPNHRSQRGLASKRSRPKKNKPMAKLPLNIDEAVVEIKRLNICYKSESCDFEKMDPKSYYFEVGKSLKRQLLNLKRLVKRDKIETISIGKIARYHLKSEDGHVKEAALHLLATQSIDDKSLDSLLENVIGFHDASLVQHGLLELLRYMGGAHEEQIHKRLAKAMQTGAPYVSEKISAHISPFLSPVSLPIYKDALSKVSTVTKTYKLLKLSLDEYRKKTSSS